MEGLTDRSRRPYRQANQLPFQVETLIVQLKREHPSWGAPKIREKIRRLPTEISLPAISTVHAVLDRNGLVNRTGRRAHYFAEGIQLSKPTQPNELWCADYKGEFMLADRRYCYPADDHRLRQSLPVVLRCLGKHPRRVRLCRIRKGFQGVWTAAGHPHRQRNSFCQPPGIFRPEPPVSVVAALGYQHRTKSAATKWASRMHLTLKKEATKPPAKNFLQQQGKFDQFMDCYNSPSYCLTSLCH